MRVYTYSEARQQLATVLKKALEDGAVRIRRQDGTQFVIAPVASTGSPFDVEGVDTALTTQEIVVLVREGRARDPHRG